MPDTITEIKNEIGQLGSELQARQTEFEKRYDGLLKESIDKVAADTAAAVRKYQDETLKAQAAERDAADEAILNKIDALEVRIAKGGGEVREQNDPHRKAWRAFLLDTDRGINAETREYFSREWKNDPEKQTRALAASTDTKGGFLVPEVVETEILKNITLLDPIRQYARVTTLTAGNHITYPRRTGTPTAYWVAEGAQATETSSTYGRGRIDVHWLSAETKVSNEMLADVPGIEGELTADAAEQMTYLEGYDFVNGSGVGKPTGFLVNATAIGGSVSGTSHSSGSLVAGIDAAYYVCFDDLVNLIMSLKSQYRANGVFAFSDATLQSIMKLKDDEGHYLWQWPQGVAGGVPTQILGKGFFISDSMPDTGTTAYKCVVFADWKQWYRIVDRQGVEVLRDPYTSKPEVEFNWYRRLGGDIYNQEAGSILYML